MHLERWLLKFRLARIYTTTKLCRFFAPSRRQYVQAFRQVLAEAEPSLFIRICSESRKVMVEALRTE